MATNEFECIESLKNDLTNRQLAEEQLKSNLKQLEKYVEEKELFCDKYEALEKHIAELQKKNFEVTRATTV